MHWAIPSHNIADGILFDSLKSASSPAALHDRNITHIISVCHEPIPAHHPQSGYAILRIPVKDEPTEDLVIHFPTACQFVHNAMLTPNAVVLVHCVQGLSRSAAVVAAYCKSSLRVQSVQKCVMTYFMSVVMWSRRMSATDALTVVRQGRNPFPGL